MADWRSRPVLSRAAGLARRASARLVRLHAGANRRLEASLAPKPAPPYRLRPYRTDAQPRILHANGNFLIGGSTQLIVDLIERLSDAYRHEVVVPHAPDPLPYQPVALTVAPPGDMQPLFEALRRDPPTAVHVHYWVRAGDEFQPVALWYDAIFRMCEQLGVPVVQNVNVPTCPHPSPAVRQNVYVSRYVMDDYDRGQAPACVIYPGSDFGHFADTGADGNTLKPETGDVAGMVYRLDADKLNERSIEVFIAAAQRRQSLRCLIVGGGQYLDLYRRHVAEAGLADRFTFTGFVSYADLPAWYRRMTVFVAPVHNESFGQVTPFAMSMGLPVAGFDVGALAEQLGGTQTLAPAGDTDALADLVVRLCADEDRRRAIGRANAARAHDRFSVETMVDAYRALYGRLLGGADSA